MVARFRVPDPGGQHSVSNEVGQVRMLHKPPVGPRTCYQLPQPANSLLSPDQVTGGVESVERGVGLLPDVVDVEEHDYRVGSQLLTKVVKKCSVFSCTPSSDPCVQKLKYAIAESVVRSPLQLLDERVLLLYEPTKGERITEDENTERAFGGTRAAKVGRRKAIFNNPVSTLVASRTIGTIDAQSSVRVLLPVAAEILWVGVTDEQLCGARSEQRHDR